MKKSTMAIPVMMVALFFYICASRTALGASHSDIKPTKFTFASFLKENNDANRAAQRFMKNVTQRTNGLVTFKTHYAGSMGSAKEIYPYTASGMLDIGLSRNAYYPGMFHLATIDELVYTGSRMDARQKAFNQLLKEFPKLQGEYAKQKLRYLAPLQSNAPSLFSRKRIMNKADFQGTKFRATGPCGNLIKAWGGTPVSMPVGDIYESVSRGILDGAFGFPPQVGAVFALQEVCKYFIDTGTGAFGMLSVVMNLNTYNGLPPSLKKIIDEEATAMSEMYPQIRMEGMRKQIPRVLKAGAEIITIPEASQKELEGLARGVQEKWVKDLAAKGYAEEQTRKIWKRMMMLYNQFAPQSTFKDFWELYEAEFKK